MPEKMESSLEIFSIYDVDVSFTSNMQSNAKLAYGPNLGLEYWNLQFKLEGKLQLDHIRHEQNYPLIEKS